MVPGRDEAGSWIMANTTKVRLAVGPFGTANELASAIAELNAQGLAPARISVIARADAFDGALVAWRKSREARAFADWIVCRSVSGAVPWAMAPAGPDETVPSTAVNDARALLGFHHWALQRHARQLHRCLSLMGDPAQRRRLGHDYRVFVRIVVHQSADALLVPLGALFRQGEAWAVFIVERSRARVRIVEVGARNAQHAEVVGGLAAGERVILHPSDRILAGVRVVERRP
jgi:hypothetical protein